MAKKDFEFFKFCIEFLIHVLINSKRLKFTKNKRDTT